jgi:hypothetical protein
MPARARVGSVLLLGLAGCPQFENSNWTLRADASSSSDANTMDSPAGVDVGAGDVVVEDAEPPDSSPPGDTGATTEAGIPDATSPDGGAVVQKIYCNLTDPRGITLDPTGNVCWVGDLNPRGLFCAPADGSGSPAHIDTPNDASFLLDAFDLVFDATSVYWSNGGNNQVVVRPQSGGQAMEYFSGGGRVSFLAAGAGATLWGTDFPDPSDSSATGSGEVIVGPSAGGTSSNAIYTGQPGAAGVAMYNDNVYWGTPAGISFGSVAGNATIYKIASPETPVAGLAVDATGQVYFLAGSRSLYGYKTGATSPVLVYQEKQGPFGAGDVAVDASYVYFSEPDLGCIVRIARGL